MVSRPRPNLEYYNTEKCKVKTVFFTRNPQGKTSRFIVLFIPCLEQTFPPVHQVTGCLCAPAAVSLLPHRFVTVRRGSPAAKSGQIRPGDRLEAVEGRSVVTLPHRELAQILRRAGNTLRLTIVPRPSTCELRLRSVAVDSS